MPFPPSSLAQTPLEQAISALSGSGTAILTGAAALSRAGQRILPMGLPSIDAVLPDGGLPRGAIVEIAAASGFSRSTTFALRACTAAQRQASLWAHTGRTLNRNTGRVIDAAASGSWCAWIDPSSTLFASGASAAGVDLSHLLVVRPTVETLAKVALRVVDSRVFSLVVIDTVTHRESMTSPRLQLDRWNRLVRRLALSVEGLDTTVLLLTDRAAFRSTPLPVSMRIELKRQFTQQTHTPRVGHLPPPGVRGCIPDDSLSLQIAKDRRGRISSAISVAV